MIIEVRKALVNTSVEIVRFVPSQRLHLEAVTARALGAQLRSEIGIVSQGTPPEAVNAWAPAILAAGAANGEAQPIYWTGNMVIEPGEEVWATFWIGTAGDDLQLVLKVRPVR